MPFALSRLGPGISPYPAIVPPSLHFRTAVLLPIFLAYTLHGYRVFRGKVRHDDGYG